MLIPRLTVCVLCMGLSAFIATGAESGRDEESFSPNAIKAIMHKVNDYTRAHPYRGYDRNWIRATWYSGVMEAYHATGDDEYLKQAQAWAEKHEWKVGTEKSGFNRLFCAMTWLELNLIEPDPAKIATTVAALKEKVPYSPAGAEIWYGHAPGPWDKRVYADSLYGAPALAMLHKATGEQQYLDILNAAFWDVTEKIYDADEDLYYRDPAYIGKKSPNDGKILWSRGNGWVFAGLPRILKHMPKDAPNYNRYIDLYRRMAKSLAARQGDDGFWRANLGDPQHYKMPESSGTAFFVAGFGWGVREGILDRDVYLPVIIRGWQALMTAVHPDGRLGWVQPVDAQPRPSNPRTTHEYAAGLFLYAGGQVYRLVEDGIITPARIQAALLRQSQMLPPTALKKDTLIERDHPLSKQIMAFMKNQQSSSITPTGLTKKDYLDVIAAQVKVMRQYQNDEGRIIDPVEKKEMYFSTPCYAHSVAVLAKAGYPIDEETIESGMKALDVSLTAMVQGRAAGGHGDFFTWPIVFADELFDGSASDQRKETWKKQLSQIDPSKYRFYRKPVPPHDNNAFYATYGSEFANNWNLVNTAGEWARVQHGFGDPWYVDYCMTMQSKNFTEFGMYHEKGDPLAYDLFSRHYLAGMLQRGYSSFLHTTYRDILWRGAWTSLFMQSPFGELPAGYRSTHHIWNEAEQAVIFEIYASAYAKAGRMAEAGAFKRAAHLSLASIKNWIRPDGTGYIVKNRYPIEAKHGYEAYSVHSCYNMLAMSMLAQAWQFADGGIAEKPCPADVGGFVVPVLKPFHKIFANAGGNYIEYDTSGDHTYNPTGILRIHLKGGHPQLGPSDGCASKFTGNGANLAVGPAWRINGKWQKLAESKEQPKVTVLEQLPQRVRFQVSYSAVTQTVTVDQTGVTVEDEITKDGVDAIRVCYPMLVFDGRDKTKVVMAKDTVQLSLADKSVNFTVIEPKGVTLQRTGKQLSHRNGMVDTAFADATGRRLVYRITAD